MTGAAAIAARDPSTIINDDGKSQAYRL